MFAALRSAATRPTIVTEYTRNNTKVVVNWREKRLSRPMDGGQINVGNRTIDLSECTVANSWHEHYFRNAPHVAAVDAAGCDTIMYSSTSGRVTFPGPAVYTPAPTKTPYLTPVYIAACGAADGLFASCVSMAGADYAHVTTFLWLNCALFLAHAAACAHDKTVCAKKRAK